MLHPEDWLKLHGDYLFSYCLLRINQKDMAEDLVQETLVSALKSKDTFRGQSSERTWLVAILKNKIIDHYRKKALKIEPLANAPLDLYLSPEYFRPEDGHWRKDAAPQPWSEGADAEMDRKEFGSVLQACISKMPPTLASIFIARFLDDEDAQVICKVHQISSSNYWVILHRAKLSIRSCLEKNWFHSKMSR